MTLKIAVLAPMPGAIVNAAVNVKAGLRRRGLAANARTRSISDAPRAAVWPPLIILHQIGHGGVGQPSWARRVCLMQLLAVRRRRSVVASYRSLRLCADQLRPYNAVISRHNRTVGCLASSLLHNRWHELAEGHMDERNNDAISTLNSLI